MDEVFTPQVAVDLLTSGGTWSVRFYEKDSLEVWGAGWSIRVLGRQSRGVAMRWNQAIDWRTAVDLGAVEWAELGELECNRIVNYISKGVNR